MPPPKTIPSPFWRKSYPSYPPLYACMLILKIVQRERERQRKRESEREIERRVCTHAEKMHACAYAYTYMHAHTNICKDSSCIIEPSRNQPPRIFRRWFVLTMQLALSTHTYSSARAIKLTRTQAHPDTPTRIIPPLNTATAPTPPLSYHEMIILRLTRTCYVYVCMRECACMHVYECVRVYARVRECVRKYVRIYHYWKSTLAHLVPTLHGTNERLLCTNTQGRLPAARSSSRTPAAWPAGLVRPHSVYNLLHSPPFSTRRVVTRVFF